MQPYVFRDEPQEISTRLNIGMKGAGKTSLLDFQLQAIRSSRRRAGGRLILVDPTTDDFHFKNFGRIVETPTSFINVFGDRPPEMFSLRVITKDPKFFDVVCLAAMRLKDCFLLCDEVWHFCPTKAGTQMDPPHFNELVTEGRHSLVRFVGTCQRPSQVHNNLLHLADELNVFRTKDVRLLKEELEGREHLRKVRYLPTYHFFSCTNARPPFLASINGRRKTNQNPGNPLSSDRRGTREAKKISA